MKSLLLFIDPRVGTSGICLPRQQLRALVTLNSCNSLLSIHSSDGRPVPHHHHHHILCSKTQSWGAGLIIICFLFCFVKNHYFLEGTYKPHLLRAVYTKPHSHGNFAGDRFVWELHWTTGGWCQLCNTMNSHCSRRGSGRWCLHTPRTAFLFRKNFQPLCTFL